MNLDLESLKKILPSHYQLEPINGGISCKSIEGIHQLKTDADDDEHWNYIVKAIKQKFPDRFQEIYHDVNFNHKQFTVFLKSAA